VLINEVTLFTNIYIYIHIHIYTKGENGQLPWVLMINEHRDHMVKLPLCLVKHHAMKTYPFLN